MSEVDPRSAILAAFRGRATPSPEWICRVCTTLVPVSGAAIVSMTDANHRETVCATDEVAEQLESLQFNLGEGPCVEALSTGRPVLVADLQQVRDARWPMFAAAAARTAARAVFSFPLQIGVIDVGVLDLYRDRPGLLTDAELSAALLGTDVALWSLLGLRTGTHPDDDPGAMLGDDGGWLTERGRARAQVHQATGMVMGQLEVTAEAALASLRAYAYAHDRPLDEVARDVVARRLRFPAPS